MEETNAPTNAAGDSDPQIIGNNLKIEQILGRGGMGTVYRATHLGLDRTVAVKVINPEFVSNSDAVKRFSREAQLMAKLRHPRAAMIYDSGTLSDGRLFIVMEYVEGETLADVLQREGKLSYRPAVEIAVSICEVLGEAHSLGIIHRDLKPANIMLNRRGIFVLDFGIAKMLHTDNPESLSLSMTGTGFLVGTPYYMSPEQCLGEKVGARSDLYSLGALLYEMIAGRPPFNDELLSAIIIKHVTAEPPPIEEFSPDVPPALSTLIKHLLSKKPEERPASAEEVRALLQASIASDGKTGAFQNYETRRFEAAPEAEQIQPLITANAAASGGVTGTAGLSVQTTNSTPSPVTEFSSAPKKGISFWLIGLPIALVLLVVIAAGGVFLFESRSKENVVASSNQSENSNVGSNSYTASNGNMSHDMGNMAMGPDFAERVDQNEKNNIASIPLISEDEADRVITRITQTTEHRADGMQIIKTPKDSAIVCIHNMIDMGKTHMFAVERPNINSQWEITARVSLDTPEFHGSNWTFEPQDVDGDGFEEVIFHGVTADDTARKVLIYSPRTRQNYWITATKDADGKFTNQTLSPNAETQNSKSFRTELQRALQSR